MRRWKDNAATEQQKKKRRWSDVENSEKVNATRPPVGCQQKGGMSPDTEVVDDDERREADNDNKIGGVDLDGNGVIEANEVQKEHSVFRQGRH